MTHGYDNLNRTWKIMLNLAQWLAITCIVLLLSVLVTLAIVNYQAIQTDCVYECKVLNYLGSTSPPQK